MSLCRFAAIGISISITGGIAGGQARAPGVVDHRSSAPPAVHISAGACPAVLGTPVSGVPNGFLGVAGATRLSNGTVVVMNAGSKQLLVFDRAGRLFASAGRVGRGPGEFSMGTQVLFPYRGDSILVVESGMGAGMVHLFSGAGAHGRTFPIVRQGSAQVFPQIAGTLVDGSIVSVALVRPIRTPTGRGIRLDSLSIGWLSPTGDHRARSAVTPNAYVAFDQEITPIPSRSGGAASRTSVRMVSPGPVSRAIPFRSTATPVAVGRDVVYHIDEPSDALVIYAPNGAAAVRVLLPPLDRRQRPSVERITGQDFAQMLEIRSDALGRAWIEAPRDQLEGERRWWIIDPEGRWVANAVTPARQRILEIGGDYFLLLRKDSDDAETVAICALERR